MSKYLIHCCPKRINYVNQYLVPSMLEQGIEHENILIYNDEKKLGNLRAYLAASQMIADDASGTWHLQDDVVISSNFKEITEEFDNGIVCGFCNQYSEDLPIGIRPVRDMWYSFMCIRIPNKILKSFVEWVKLPAIQNKYRVYVEAGKFDDTLFRAYMLANHQDMLVQNLYPNIVDNIDFLLGGSLINYMRKSTDNINSIYFQDKELVENLERKMSNSNLQV